MRNRAGQSSSPYVQSHASSPVKWQLLDDEAVSRAKRENKLIFLNVGFSACHYCRLMSQESFAHPAVSSLLNKSFIPIIVDREERSDVDAVYMNYLQAVMGTGGWPLNLSSPRNRRLFLAARFGLPQVRKSTKTMQRKKPSILALSWRGWNAYGGRRRNGAGRKPARCS